MLNVWARGPLCVNAALAPLVPGFSLYLHIICKWVGLTFIRFQFVFVIILLAFFA